MSTEQMLKDSLSLNMPLNNIKFSSLFRDGNLQFSTDHMKRNFPAIVSFPSESALLHSTTSSSSSANTMLFPNLNQMNGIRSSMGHFNGLVSQPINIYGPHGITGFSTINSYFFDSIEHLQHLGNVQKSSVSSRILQVPTHSENFIEMNSHPRRKNATRETTSILKAWLNEHKKNPYPTKGEKIMLAVITKMTLTQVSTWFANARRRLKKENKMTWSPNHKSDDEPDDLDDTDSSDIPTKLQEDPSVISKTFSKNLQKEFLSKFPNFNSFANDSSETKLSPDLLKSTKPKIWSIADITSESKEESNMDKTLLSSSSQENDRLTFSSPPLSNISIHPPALKFLFCKHPELDHEIS